MVSSLGLTTSFHRLGAKEHERMARKGFELVTLSSHGNGVVISKDWDPARPTLLFCHGRDGSAGSSGYMNIPQDIGKHKFGGACNIAIVLHQAPGNQNTMVADGIEALDYITQQMGARSARIEDVHLAGYSIGCITASALANSHPKAARLTLLLPPTSIPEAAEHTFANKGWGALSKMAGWATRIVTGNDRSTVDYIAKMHERASARGMADVMPVEALLSRDDKVADPQAFIKGLEERGVRDAVNIAVEEMQNSPTAHTHAFSLDLNFPQLVGSELLHQDLPRIKPLATATQLGAGRG